jgi:hypothetical protein
LIFVRVHLIELEIYLKVAQDIKYVGCLFTTKKTSILNIFRHKEHLMKHKERKVTSDFKLRKISPTVTHACRKRRLKWIATLPLGDINIEAWSSGMGVGRGANNFTL